MPVDKCWGPDTGGDTIQYTTYVPCFQGNETHPIAPCCSPSQLCLEDATCLNADYNSYNYTGQSFSAYQVAVCTDKNYEDADYCSSHCQSSSTFDKTYVDEEWHCCDGNCTDLDGKEQWRDDPAPDQLATFTSLAANWLALITADATGVGQPAVSLALTNLPSFTALLGDATITPPGSWPTWYSTAPDDVKGFLESGQPTANLYTGPGTYPIAPITSSIPAPTAPVSHPPASAASSRPGGTKNGGNSDDNSSVIGPAVGVPVGVIALALIAFGIWFFLRRRKRRNAKNSPQRSRSTDQEQSYTPMAATQQSGFETEKKDAASQNYGNYYQPVEYHEADGTATQRHEMPGATPAQELPSNLPPQELQGSEPVVGRP